LEGMLFGDRATDMIFDNNKLKSTVPDFICTTDFRAGIRRTIAYYIKNPEMMRVDYAWDAQMDRMIANYIRQQKISKYKSLNLKFSLASRGSMRDWLVYIFNRYLWLARVKDIFKET
jgi:hypothetical protein